LDSFEVITDEGRRLTASKMGEISQKEGRSLKPGKRVNKEKISQQKGMCPENIWEKKDARGRKPDREI